MITVFIIYQSSKFSFSCVLLVESVSREIDEIRLSPLHQRARETMHYSPVNNKKIMCTITGTRDLWTAENRNVFKKLIKYFMYFRMKFALFFRFFDSWYIIKYLLTETSGKQYVLWTLDCRCSLGFALMFPEAKPRETSTVSVPQNILFPLVSVNKC